MKKILCLLLILITSFPINALPNNVVRNENDETKAVQCPYKQTYVERTGVQQKSIDEFGVEAENKSSTMQYITKSVSRTISATISAGGSVEFKAILAGAKLQAEISFLGSEVETTVIGTNVPAYTTMYMDYGSIVYKTEGSLVTVDWDCSKEELPIHSEYTVREYVRWYE